MSGAGFDRVREQADREGLGERLQLVHADVREWTALDRFDVVLSVGAAYAFGGSFPRSRRWVGTSTPMASYSSVSASGSSRSVSRALALLGADVEDYDDLATTVDAVTSAGWVPLEGHISSMQEWDTYEWSWTGSLASWALNHPDHPDSHRVMTTSVKHRRAWIEGYRGTLGFLTMLLRRSTSTRAAQ